MEKKKKKVKTKSLIIVIAIACVITGTTCGFFIGRDTVNRQNIKEMSMYDTIASIVENQFYDTTESEDSIEKRMLSGMVAGLGDKYTTYMEADTHTDFVTTLNGNIKGIGITFTSYGLGAMVNEVFSDSPADKAGLLKGDFITKINGTSLVDKTTEEVKEIIQSKDNATLEIYRDGKKQEINITLEEINTSVTYNIDGDLGYLRISTFGSTTASSIESTLKEFKNKGVKKICIDLRGNGGGYVDSAQNVLNLFIPKGEVMFTTQNNKKSQDYKASDKEKYTFDQGYILVNNQTASASEIVTSCLSEVLNYQIIGQHTYGKSVVQTDVPLSSTQNLKITTSSWLTSRGERMEKDKGITPHYKIDDGTLLNYSFTNLEEPLKYDTVTLENAMMQMMLKTIGYDSKREDGYFSKETEKQLKKFEKDNHLKVDGILSNDDALILISKLGAYYSSVNNDKIYSKMLELSK